MTGSRESDRSNAPAEPVTPDRVPDHHSYFSQDEQNLNENSDPGTAHSPAVRRWEALLSERHHDALELPAPNAPAGPNTAETFANLFHFVRSQEGDWGDLADGVMKKVLLSDPAGQWETYLLRITPGYAVPGHAHQRLEECLIIEGDIQAGGLAFGPGDYHAIGAGLAHPDLASNGGAVILIRGEIRAAARA